MKARRIRIVNYRGIQEAEIPVGAGGVIAKGRCESGKTSFLDAFRAALVATGVQASDIHRGADKAEVIVDVETLRSVLTVRRGITKHGTSLTVTNDEGFKMDAPQTRLKELLGGGGFDPLEFFLAKDSERRRIILDATPVKLTVEDVRRWVPDEKEPDAIVPLDGHGLEVLGRLRKWYYDLRTGANKAEKEVRATCDRAAAAATALKEHRNDALDPQAVRAEVEKCRRMVLDIEARQRAALAARETTRESRARIQSLRADAESREKKAAIGPETERLTAASDAVTSARAVVDRIRAELVAAEATYEAARVSYAGLEEERDDAEAAARQAAQLRARADEVEAALVGAVAEVPESEDEAATAAFNAAQAQAEAMDRAEEERKARCRFDEAFAAVELAAEKGRRLDRIVDVLTNQAPKDLTARGNVIPGFDVETMSLDGVPLDSLSGGQKLEFAVSLAKRANPEARILICDGLERLDPERMQAFVEMATSDNWQLIASRVEAGAIEFEAIEA